MTFAWAQPLGYIRTDQETLIPILDRGMDACVRGTLMQDDGSEFKAVAAILYWLEHGEQAGRIEMDFPRFKELQAVCAVETLKRFQRANNQRIYDKAIEDGLMGIAV
jgi:cytochrome c